MVAAAGDYPVPTSEAVYLANLASIDVVVPTNGGRLQADGSWLQEDWKIDPAWPQSVPALAVANGQLYFPTLQTVDPASMTTVLDSPALQDAAVSALVTLATTGRFDSPWDGVFVDFEGIPSAYKSQLSQFVSDIAEAIRAVGLLCAISVRGKASDPGTDYDSAYSYDFEVVGEAADYVDLRLYGFWNPLVDPVRDRSTAPYWWMEDCIEYALTHGMSASQLLLGYGSYGIYYPVSDEHVRDEITYDQFATIYGDAGTFPTWVESATYGRIREKTATIGAGHEWDHDADTARHALGLTTENSLYGVAYFVPGMEDAGTWTVIDEWRAGAGSWNGYISVINLALAGGQYSTLLAIVLGQGRLSDDNPRYITHSRVVSGAETIVEAVFRYGEMIQDQCAQWLGTVLDVDPADVTVTEAADAWTLTHGGTDYATIELFGGFGSTWEQSRADVLAYL